ncbi:endolytic transglycosylase MltG [Streptomyces beijiangensis]|uniref:Endolytic murein transglycosylase n=1 Tax=Streptomyces beijiangensis TaxID=163361 RepID=A0A939F7J3_9ACTN|nr:endolytic transglycosylase MltG [Streptomyces beijiangensis]MBO0511875.1 endolytic transglycosylase MltG [Streptomyces beijiangensis]
MTEYGRGAGSEPWHPEDPLYGDQGWGGQQAAPGHQDPYGGGQQQQYPQQQPQYGNQQDQQNQQYGNQQYGQDPYQQDPYQQDPYAQQPQQQPQHPQQPQQPQYNGGWDTGQQAAMPYNANPADPYGGQQPQYSGENPDYYRTPDAYPPPQPPGRRDEWQPEAPPAEEDHPFFTGGGGDGGDADDDFEDEPGRGGRGDRRNKSKPKKRRSGCACLVVTAVLVGGGGGVAYFGYSYYQSHFSAPADYSGMGADPVQVEIPKGTTIAGFGRLLKEKGVVKSVEAFVSATEKNPKGKFLQAGVYSLNQKMSAANAVNAIVDPKSLNVVMVVPGERNKQVYAAIDTQLALKAGSTEAVAKAQVKSLGLPGWANSDKDIKDPLEGFLYPASYPAAKGMKPEAILKSMVDQANEAYGKQDLVAEAKRLNLKSPLQVITVASLVQAEGISHDDFKKMSEVVYNRLKPSNDVSNGKLEFDSAFNYLKNQSKIKISTKEIRTNPDPYNTYYHTGLPPGPIGNPGADALAATLSPTSGGWMYFISLDGKTTQFTKTLAEHDKLTREFNKKHNIG